MRILLSFTLATFLTVLANAFVAIPSLSDFPKRGNTLTGPKKPVKRYTIRSRVKKCPAKSMPANATKFGGSSRTSNTPQGWSLDCYVGDQNNKSPTNWFSSSGQCGRLQIAFDDIDSTLRPHQVVCVYNAPMKVILGRMITREGFTTISPSAYDVNTRFEYVQIVLTRHKDRTAFHTASAVTLTAFGQSVPRGGPQLETASCVDCSSLSIHFSASTVSYIGLQINAKDEHDDVDVHAYFSSAH